MILYIVRHADPIYETDTITEYGQKQAEALAKRMQTYNLSKIYCSPMGRAIATVKPTCRLLDMDYTIEHWTREMIEYVIDIPGRGRDMAINVGGAVFRNPDNIGLGKKWYKADCFKEMKGKEVYHKLVKHSDEFLARHGYERVEGRYKILQHNDERIAVFCHGGFGLTWLAHLLEIPVSIMWAGFGMSTTSVTKLVFEDNPTGWTAPRCHYLSDISHLYAEKLVKEVSRRITT